MSRKLFAIRIWLLLAVIATSLVGAPARAAGPTVRVNPSFRQVAANDTFSMAIQVDTVASLTAVEVHLAFNPAVLEVTGMSNGGFVAADFTAQNTFDNGAGTIDYAIAQLNKPAATGSGVVLNIAFRAKANGNSDIDLRSTQAAPSGLLLSDQNGSPITYTWAKGSVNVGNGPTSTTAPATSTTVPPTKTAVPPSATTGPTATSGGPTATKTATPTASVTPSKTAVPTTPATPGTLGTHTVRWGESLYCIGRAYKVDPQAIAKANNIWLWPYWIFPGQTLTIPNVVWSPIPSGPVCSTQFTPGTPVPTVVPTVAPTAGGPTLTPTPVTPTATPQPAGSCRAYYTVKRGDNLFRIALAYGLKYQDLARVNNIADPRVIYVGQQLCIP